MTPKISKQILADSQNLADQTQPHPDFVFSVAPYYHALNSCFFAQIWVIVRMHASSGKFRASVSSAFCWRDEV
jgi:hypothetical protein